jgi:CHAT domain-containing protein/Tfp pilus assembly protein PilF
MALLLLSFFSLEDRANARPEIETISSRSNVGEYATSNEASEPRSEKDVARLELGQSVDRNLAGGQTNEYELDISEGQYASVIIVQRGIDVEVSVFEPDSHLIARFDSEARRYGEERVEFVGGKTAGTHTIRVQNKVVGAIAGQYTIRLHELRPATPKDQSLNEARRLYTEAFNLYWPRLDLRKAQVLAERSLQLLEAEEGIEHPDLAQILVTLAWIHRLRGEPEFTLPMLERALAIRQKAFGPEHLAVADSLNQVGLYWWNLGHYSTAEAFNQKVLEIREKSLGPMDLSVADSLNNLANIEMSTGNYAAAKPLYKRVLEIREKLLGLEDKAIAKALEELAAVYVREGDFAMSHTLLERGVDICKKNFGFQNHRTTDALTRLADSYLESGDYTKARSLYQQSLGILEKMDQVNDAAIGHALYKLGSFNHRTGDETQAESFYLRAIDVWQNGKRLGSHYLDIAPALEGLGEIYQARGNYVRAKEVFLRALYIFEKNSGSNHPDVARVLNHLANIYSDEGDYRAASPLYHRALTISDTSNGPNNPFVAEVLGNLFKVSLAMGDVGGAIEFQARANPIVERNIELNLASGSERWKLAYLSSLSDITDRSISLHLRFAPDDQVARTLATLSVIQRKGRVQDAMSDSLAALRRRSNPQDQALLDRLSMTTAQLARLVLNGPEQMDPGEHQQRIKDLEAQKEKIEEEISRSTKGAYERPTALTLAAVRSTIPANSALVELTVYRPFDPKPAGGKEFGRPRYVAYVIRNDGEVKWKELGAASEIDESVEALRKGLRDPSSKNVRQLLRTVDEKVMQPIRALVGDSTQLLISADGELNLIPFAALVDEQNRYLIENYSVVYLTSGRDLLRMQLSREDRSRPLVVANPLFGEQVTNRASTSKSVAANHRRRSVVTARSLTDVYFAPLSGTMQEARTIQTLFPRVGLLTEAQATESALKRVAAPRILHIATHGFFLQDEEQQPRAVNSEDLTRGIKVNSKIENPLLRSGLALAGANLTGTQAEKEDGVLTALEASGLDLWGTKLVVLSACDTGVGEVRTGEGVYGLRRAFSLAGGESLVMSLWPISDYATRKLMADYYKNLKQGLGRGEALRQVQLTMLRQNGKLHPFYWANFIQAGDWTELKESAADLRR